MRRLLSLSTPPELAKEFEPTEESGTDYLSKDGRRLLEILLHPQGVRDLHAHFLRVAQELAQNRRLTKAILVVWMPRPTNDRVAREWRSTLELFKTPIADRMSLVIVRPEASQPMEEDKSLFRIGEIMRSHLGRVKETEHEPQTVLTPAFVEIFKVLFNQWILKRGPMAIGELMRRTGSSYPTVADAVRRLERTQELARRSNRSVQLSRFPEKTWFELLALSESLRRTRYYADASGGRTHPLDLNRRLQATPYKHLAVGGVQAARHWDPDFDLNGLPRLDVTLHMAHGIGDWGFVERLDPALKRVDSRHEGIVLAVHPLLRAEPHFEKNPKSKIDWADPVEVLLDLYELRLIDQAEHMIRHLSGTLGQ